MEGKHINYVAVARLAATGVPASILAERVHRQQAKYDYNDHVVKILHSPGWSEVNTNRLSLQDGQFKFHLLIAEDLELVFVAVTTLEYPGRHVFGHSQGAPGCLQDIKEQFIAAFGQEYKRHEKGTLTQPASVLLKNICKEYNDLKNLDKVERVKVQVGEVATMMRENINSVADMSDRLDDVCSRSDQLKMLSQDFENKAEITAKQARNKNRKVAILVAVLACGIIAVAVTIYMSVRTHPAA